MPTTVGHHLLTSQSVKRMLANSRWPTFVGKQEPKEHKMPSMDLPVRTRVAIVGGGPTGLALAVTLASAGVDFVVVDRLAEGANTSQPAVVFARTLEVLAELGATGDLIRRGFPVTRFAENAG